MKSLFSELIEIVDFYPALGNHERDSQLFFDNFSLPNNEQWYSLEINGIHFIVLDSNSDTSGTSEQYRWLKERIWCIWAPSLPMAEPQLW